MIIQDHLIYIGPRQELRGKSALIIFEPGADRLKAQFDDTSLLEAFGWQQFPATDFTTLPE